MIAHDKQVFSARKPIQFEETGILDNGQIQTFFSYKAPLFNDENNIIGLLGISFDFTYQKQHEEKLIIAKQNAEAAAQAKLKFTAELVEQITGQQASTENTFEQHILQIRNYFENIISFMPGLVFWKDEKGIYLGCNSNLAETFKLKTRHEVIGKTDYEIFDKETAQRLRETDAEIMASGQSKNIEESTTFANDELRIFLTNKVPLYNEAKSKVIGVLGVSLDIRERKKMEAALKVAQEQESETRRALMIISGSMAHDLRNPLIVTRMISNSMNKHFAKLVEGYKKAQTAGLVAGDELTDFQLDYLANAPNKLLESIEQMNTFIDDDLKTISHVVSGSKSRDDLIECRINSCITKAINYYPFEGNDKDLVEWKSGDNFVFLGNPVLFYRIIFNLLKNALYQIKKHNNGKIYITTELKGDINILRFKDTAGGVTNEIVSNLFQDFNTTKKEGTGIGLAFCKFTMQSFDGDIIAQCVDDDCIEFVINFPISTY